MTYTHNMPPLSGNLACLDLSWLLSSIGLLSPPAVLYCFEFSLLFVSAVLCFSVLTTELTKEYSNASLLVSHTKALTRPLA